MFTLTRFTSIVAGVAALVLVATAAAAQPPSAAVAPAAKPALTDLDAFMAKVIEKRNENWRTLHDYILSERETFELTGPADIPLHSLRRDFQWFIREGYLVRSPLNSNGVALSKAERQKYEDRWLAEEKKREAKANEKNKDEARKVELKMSLGGDVECSGLAEPGVEPRFLSEAYFMKFRFEPGNYFFAGSEQLDGRRVLKIEYLPSAMFNDDEEHKKKADDRATVAPPDTQAKDRKAPRKDDEDDARIERAMNKTSTVTMWIDPEEYQIVRFRFDNVDWGFLPGRQVVRIDDARAAMTMGREFENIWLPREVTMTGALTLATGTVRFTYKRAFSDYRRGEVSARIRGYATQEPR